MKKVLLFLFIVLSLISFTKITAQSGDTVAIVGDTYISKNEFLKRFEMTPWPRGAYEETSEGAKNELLYTLIAEKLWAQRAKELNADTAQTLKTSFSEIEKMYARDALYKKEISGKIQPTQKLLQEAYRRAQIDLKVNYASFFDKSDAQKFYDLLNRGLEFDSAKALSKNILSDSLIQVSYGEVEEFVEDSLYQLLPGGFTYPVPAPNSWFVFMVEEVIEKPVKTTEESQALENKMSKVIESRLTEKRLKEYQASFFENKNVNVNGKIIGIVTEKAVNIIASKQQNQNGSFSLNFYDIKKIENDFSQEELKQPVIKLDNENISLKYFLDAITFEEFTLRSNEPNYVKAAFHTRIRNFIDKELLARQALKEGLQALPEVKDEIKMWKEAYLSQIGKSEFLNSVEVTDKEIENYYSQRNVQDANLVEVKVIEILNNDLEIIEHVLIELNKGARIQELAANYSQRSGAKENKGDLGFINSSNQKEIWEVASKMEIGEVYGPLKLNEGYSIFKVTDKKSSQVNSKSFAEAKDEIKNNLSTFKTQRGLSNFTAKLANDYGVKVNEETLKEIKVTNTTMFAYKYLGFGGRITAVPLVTPFADWVKQWKENQQDLP